MKELVPNVVHTVRQFLNVNEPNQLVNIYYWTSVPPVCYIPYYAKCHKVSYCMELTDSTYLDLMVDKIRVWPSGEIDIYAGKCEK